MRWVANTEADLWARIEVGLPDHCWPYRTDVSTRGYGRFCIGSKRDYAHRLVYRICHGQIPAGQVVDHICHNQDKGCPGGPACEHRKCCNPYHMELTTNGENIRRSHNAPANMKYCKRDHEMTEENTYMRPDGKGRQCLTCIRIRTRKPGSPMWNRDAKTATSKGCPGK